MAAEVHDLDVAPAVYLVADDERLRRPRGVPLRPGELVQHVVHGHAEALQIVVAEGLHPDPGRPVLEAAVPVRDLPQGRE